MNLDRHTQWQTISWTILTEVSQTMVLGATIGGFKFLTLRWFPHETHRIGLVPNALLGSNTVLHWSVDKIKLSKRMFKLSSLRTDVKSDAIDMCMRTTMRGGPLRQSSSRPWCRLNVYVLIRLCTKYGYLQAFFQKYQISPRLESLNLWDKFKGMPSDNDCLMIKYPLVRFQISWSRFQPSIRVYAKIVHSYLALFFVFNRAEIIA